MNYRIITHAACTDGFCSAFVVKKYLMQHWDKNLSEEDIKKIPVIGVKPYEMRDFEFKGDDIVVDLPRPHTQTFAWIDHHASNKPEEGEKLPERYVWGKHYSNAGLLLEIAQKEFGLELTPKLKEFKEASELIDAALYTKEVITECYYYQDNFDNPSILLQLHFLGELFHTRDRELNSVLFNAMLSTDLGEIPTETQLFKEMHPVLFHKAALNGFNAWREQLDTYVEYDEESRTSIQDSRKILRSNGNVDRFYVYMKYPKSVYGVNIKVIRDEEQTARIGIGSNIFHKDWCKAQIGDICEEISRKFGNSTGGGHPYVGSTTVYEKNIDEALKMILEKLKASLE